MFAHGPVGFYSLGAPLNIHEPQCNKVNSSREVVLLNIKSYIKKMAASAYGLVQGHKSSFSRLWKRPWSSQTNVLYLAQRQLLLLYGGSVL